MVFSTRKRKYAEDDGTKVDHPAPTPVHQAKKPKPSPSPPLPTQPRTPPQIHKPMPVRTPQMIEGQLTPPYTPAPTETDETDNPITEGTQKVQLKPGRKWEVFFGREISGDAVGVTDELLAYFLDNELTARFPQGMTYTGATGQWMRTNDNGNEVIKEGTTVVFLVEFDDGDGGKVDKFRELVIEAAQQYKTVFRQDAVLVCEIACLMEFV